MHTICLALALVINLTLTPALLLSFKLFSTFRCCRSARVARDTVEDPLVEPASPMRAPIPARRSKSHTFTRARNDSSNGRTCC